MRNPPDQKRLPTLHGSRRELAPTLAPTLLPSTLESSLLSKGAAPMGLAPSLNPELQFPQEPLSRGEPHSSHSYVGSPPSKVSTDKEPSLPFNMWGTEAIFSMLCGHSV